jgi:hypothetical protein
MKQSPSFFTQTRNFLHFVESNGSLPHSQVSSTRPYPEPDQICVLIIDFFLSDQQPGPSQAPVPQPLPAADANPDNLLLPLKY